MEFEVMDLAVTRYFTLKWRYSNHLDEIFIS